MNCELFREVIFDYMGGGLDADSLGDFRGHYGSCPECAGTLRMIEAQETILTAWPQPKAPDALWGRVQRDLADRERLRWLERRPGAGRWLAVAAALLIAVLGLVAFAAHRAPADPGLPLQVVDISTQPSAGALGRWVPGYENPKPAAPVFDTLLGLKD